MSYLPRIAETYPAISLSREELAYYARHILLPNVGYEGQRKLKTARVLVIGAGGLGCPAMQSLAGAGVGKITVVDGDCVAVSNVSRQWLHSYASAGSNKAESARDALVKLNPFIEFVAISEMFSENNGAELIQSHDLVIDATDDLDVRYLIDRVCGDYDRPWIHAALYRDSSQLTVFWKKCGASFLELYPEPSSAPSCSGAGMLGAVASVVANMQALEAIKLITGNGIPGIGRLSVIDSSSLDIRKFQYGEVEEPELFVDKDGDDSDYRMSVSQLKQALSIHETIKIVDLRKDGASFTFDSVRLSEEDVLEKSFERTFKGKIVLVCEEGLISSMLATALHGSDSRIHYLEGGANAWRMFEGG